MNKTEIEYLDYTWNPFAMRCDQVSPGCDHCWHLGRCKRLAKNPILPGMTRQAYDGGFPVMTHHLEDPLHIRKPSQIGVQFMGDWMHPSINEGMIDQILEVISACPQHQFFTLTKRPEYLKSRLYEVTEKYPIRELGGGDYIPNLWLGVTVCNQWEIDHKLPGFIQIHSFKKWVSLEPLLGDVKIKPFLYYLDWIVAGAETGPGARPAENDWFRSVRDQCRAAGVPFFMKATTGETPEDLRVREFPE